MHVNLLTDVYIEKEISSRRRFLPHVLVSLASISSDCEQVLKNCFKLHRKQERYIIMKLTLRALTLVFRSLQTHLILLHNMTPRCP